MEAQFSDAAFSDILGAFAEIDDLLINWDVLMTPMRDDEAFLDGVDQQNGTGASPFAFKNVPDESLLETLLASGQMSEELLKPWSDPTSTGIVSHPSRLHTCAPQRLPEDYPLIQPLSEPPQQYTASHALQEPGVGHSVPQTACEPQQQQQHEGGEEVQILQSIEKQPDQHDKLLSLPTFGTLQQWPTTRQLPQQLQQPPPQQDFRKHSLQPCESVLPYLVEPPPSSQAADQSLGLIAAGSPAHCSMGASSAGGGRGDGDSLTAAGSGAVADTSRLNGGSGGASGYEADGAWTSSISISPMRQQPKQVFSDSGVEPGATLAPPLSLLQWAPEALVTTDASGTVIWAPVACLPPGWTASAPTGPMLVCSSLLSSRQPQRCPHLRPSQATAVPTTSLPSALGNRLLQAGTPLPVGVLHPASGTGQGQGPGFTSAAEEAMIAQGSAATSAAWAMTGHSSSSQHAGQPPGSSWAGAEAVNTVAPGSVSFSVSKGMPAQYPISTAGNNNNNNVVSLIPLPPEQRLAPATGQWQQHAVSPAPYGPGYTAAAAGATEPPAPTAAAIAAAAGSGGGAAAAPVAVGGPGGGVAMSLNDSVATSLTAAPMMITTTTATRVATAMPLTAAVPATAVTAAGGWSSSFVDIAAPSVQFATASRAVATAAAATAAATASVGAACPSRQSKVGLSGASLLAELVAEAASGGWAAVATGLAPLPPSTGRTAEELLAGLDLQDVFTPPKPSQAKRIRGHVRRAAELKAHLADRVRAIQRLAAENADLRGRAKVLELVVRCRDEQLRLLRNYHTSADGRVYFVEQPKGLAGAAAVAAKEEDVPAATAMVGRHCGGSGVCAMVPYIGMNAAALATMPAAGLLEVFQRLIADVSVSLAEVEAANAREAAINPFTIAPTAATRTTHGSVSALPPREAAATAAPLPLAEPPLSSTATFGRGGGGAAACDAVGCQLGAVAEGPVRDGGNGGVDAAGSGGVLPSGPLARLRGQMALFRSVLRYLGLVNDEVCRFADTTLTGSPGAPEPGHWLRVVQDLGLDTQQLADAAALHSCWRDWLDRIHGERRRIAAALDKLLSVNRYGATYLESVGQYGTDRDAIHKMHANVMRERILVLLTGEVFCGHILTDLQWARAITKSYPYILDARELICAASQLYYSSARGLAPGLSLP